MKWKWLYGVVFVFSVMFLFGCSDTSGSKEEVTSTPGNVRGTEETVRDGAGGVVRSRVIRKPGAEAKKLFANDRNIYVMGNKGIEQRHLDGSFVREWKSKEVDDLLYVDREYIYGAMYYYPDDDGDENMCTDIFSIPIGTGEDGEDVLLLEQKEKIVGGLSGVVYRPCYIDSDHLVCVLAEYDFGADLLRYDRKSKKAKSIFDDEYWGGVSFAVVGNTLFLFMDDILSCQGLDSDGQVKLGSECLYTWSDKYFFLQGWQSVHDV